MKRIVGHENGTLESRAHRLDQHIERVVPEKGLQKQFFVHVCLLLC